MKKIFLTVLIFIIAILSLNIPAQALNDTETVLKNIDSDTKQYLSELGVDPNNASGIDNLSLKSVTIYIFNLITDSSKSISVHILSVVAVIILNAILTSFLEKDNSAKTVLNYISILCIVTVIIIPLKDLIINTGAVIKTAAIFTDCYVPVLVSLITASGNPRLALTYNSFAIVLSSFISEVADSFFKPVINMLFAFNILTSFTLESYKHKLFKSVKKMIIIILSLISTVYTGLLTTQSILAVSSDSLTVRGIRFFSGTFIPVVGAGVSESISSVISSITLMKNTVGVLVIVIILLIFLPIIVDLLIWYFALQFTSIIGDLFGNDEISTMLDEMSSIVALINTILFYITFVLIVSTGIIIVSGK